MLRWSGCIGSRSDPFSLVLAQRAGREPVVTGPGAMGRSPSRRGERETEVVGRERGRDRDTERLDQSAGGPALTPPLVWRLQGPSGQ